MLNATLKLHRTIADVGRKLGFESEFEVSDTLLRVRLDDEPHYQPRLDVLWSLPLSLEKRSAIGWALGREADSVPAHLPVCGWEIEATSPSTKTLAADVANLTALGAPFGFLGTRSPDNMNS